MKSNIIFFLIFILFVSISANASNSFLEKGISYYNEGQYDNALNSFLEVAESGVQNGKLYYNIGNAYFKLGNIGKSIVWYKRAKKLIPNDPDLNFNLNYLKSFLKDETEKDGLNFSDFLFFWKDKMNSKSIQYIAIFFNALLFIFLSTALIFKKQKSKLKLPILITIVFTSIFIATSFYNFFTQNKQGIILSYEITVRSGFSDVSTELFKLHEGTTVTIKEETEEFYKIVFDSDKVGWVKKESLDII